MPITSKSAQEIASLCDGSHRTGDSYRAKCPAHGGNSPNSLHIWERDGKTYLKCFSRDCKPDDILRAIGIEPDWVPKKDQNQVEYDYTDEQGNMLFQSVRMYRKGKKTFRQRHKDETKPGGWAWTTKGVRRVIYRLPNVLRAIEDGQPILIVEGEKDVHTAESLGYAATTNVGGATHWTAEDSKFLIGANVVIIPDDDEKGREHLAVLRSMLTFDIVSSLIVVNLQERECGWDLTDWVKDGGTREQLDGLIENAYREQEPKEDGPRPEIYVDPTDITGTVDACVEAMQKAELPLYQRDGIIVVVKRSVYKDTTKISNDVSRLSITRANIEYIQELATQAARWFVPAKSKGTDVYKPNSCPKEVAAHLAARPSLTFPVLTSITTVPILKANGHIVDNPGYDEETGIYYEPFRDYPPIPDSPTRNDALKAFDVLLEPFVDFEFESDCHRSAAVSGILSIHCRHLCRTVPLHAVTSNTRGAGKGMLVNVFSIAATGQDPSKRTASKDDEEMRKALLPIAMSGNRVTVFDNVANGAFGTPSLERALTEPFIEDRILGKSENTEVMLQTTFFATANNLKLSGDMARRVLPIVISPTCENPEERTNFKIPDLLDWIHDHHPRMVEAALTIMRAYILAGKPTQDIAPYGSFEGWSDLVRSAIVWLGHADPCEGRVSIEIDADPAYETLQTLIHAWKRCFPSEIKNMMRTILQMVKNANDDQSKGKKSYDDSMGRRDYGGERSTTQEQKEVDAAKKFEDDKLIELGEALLAFDYKANDKLDSLNSQRIGRALPVNNGASRIIDGMRLRKETDTHTKTSLWWVEDVKDGTSTTPEGTSNDTNGDMLADIVDDEPPF